MKRRQTKATATRCPEAERAFLAGLLELIDNPARCREAAGLVSAGDLTIEWGRDLLEAIEETLALEGPTVADVTATIRRRAKDPAADGQEPAVALAVDLLKASASNRGAYGLGVERHASEIRKAAALRHRQESTARLVDVAADPDAQAEEIKAAALEVAQAADDVPADRLEWVPFPVDLLPDPVGSFVAQAAAALGTDPAFVAIPLLASIAASIGNRRRIELWPGWQEPPILWCATVAESGSMKTPAADRALRFVRDRQKAAFATHREALAIFDQEQREYESQRRSRSGEPPAPPERPVAERLVVDDVTVEALAPIVASNPRGVLIDRDELSGWFDFDRYSGGRGGAEVGRWLSTYNAGPLTVDRKHSETIYVPSAAVSIAGGIQPQVLARVVGSRHVDNGLLQRFILAAPPRRMKTIPGGDVDFATMASMEGMFSAILDSQPAEDNGPRVLDLVPDAADRFKAFYLEHGAEQFAASGPLASMLAKAEGWAARLALVCHVIAEVGSDPGRGGRVRLESIEAGIGLARWAAREWQRVFKGICAGSLEADDRGLVEWISARGGSASVRDVQRGLRRYQSPGAAEAALQRLAKSGRASWQAGQTGGRPADAVRLKM